MKLIKTVLTILFILTVAASAIAQDRKPLPADEQSLYVVSAKAGVVNVIEGDVSSKPDKGDWAKLLAGDELREGALVKTGAKSQAEILLTPGCYLRLAENTQFILSSTSAIRFKIDILAGSAIVEASVIEGTLTVATPKTEFSIIREGLYRFNVASDGKAEAAVRKGKVAFGQAIVKEDKKGVFDNGTFAIAKYDKKEMDEFDLWSKDRAKTLIAANRRLSGRTLPRSAVFGFVSNVWIRDSACGCYTFLPFGTGFSSPYGGGYAVCNPYWYSYRRNGYGWGNGGGRYNGGSASSGGSSSNVGSGRGGSSNGGRIVGGGERTSGGGGGGRAVGGSGGGGRAGGGNGGGGSVGGGRASGGSGGGSTISAPSRSGGSAIPDRERAQPSNRRP